jgi:hypothetical protein
VSSFLSFTLFFPIFFHVFLHLIYIPFIPFLIISPLIAFILPHPQKYHLPKCLTFGPTPLLGHSFQHFYLPTSIFTCSGLPFGLI